MVKKQHLGAIPVNDGADTFFRVWAPNRMTVEVDFSDGLHPLTKGGDGYFSGTVIGKGAGEAYRYVLDGDISRPDPTSRFQPEGVHGPSMIVDPAAYRWRSPDWQGVAREELVIYEIHVGTFTEAGTFLAAIDRLDELVELGITALEIMPVAQSAGRWGWGYDGVNLFAPAHPYGAPDDLKALVDACHQRGMAAILDVVYNHLGPEGNYLADFGPYNSKKHRTPWGAGLNYDGRQARPVRDFICENVRYWLEEYQLDGLRVDAIRLMFDDSEITIVEEMERAARDVESRVNRPIHLIGETNLYDSSLLATGYDAVWSDEISHGIMGIVLQQNEVARRQYRDANDLRLCLEQGYLYEHRDGECVRDESGKTADFSRIVQGLQTHDQVGNHPLGLRFVERASAEAQRASVALMLLYPSIPFLFMGEEFASTPFCFFADYGDEHLRKALVEGRARDYDHFEWSESISPISEEAFVLSKLPPLEAGDGITRRWYQDLLRVRKEWRSAGILSQENLSIEVRESDSVFVLNYGNAWVAARLGVSGTVAEAVKLDLPGEVLLRTGEGSGLGVNQAAVGWAG